MVYFANCFEMVEVVNGCAVHNDENLNCVRNYLEKIPCHVGQNTIHVDMQKVENYNQFCTCLKVASKFKLFICATYSIEYMIVTCCRFVGLTKFCLKNCVTCSSHSKTNALLFDFIH